MKVFISWSGDASKQLGEALKEWIPSVLQAVTPYFTPSDIEKGTRWSADISRELEASQVGFLCLTRENIHSDWLLFEAGALSKSLDKAHVCPILFGVSPADLSGPLQQFQATAFSKQDFQRLISTINSKTDPKLPQKTFETVFEKWWPDIETKIKSILENITSDNDKPMRSERELLEEVLMRVRGIPRLAPGNVPIPALLEILQSYIELHNDQVRGNGGYQDTLDMLKKMHGPLLYILSKNRRRSEDLDSLIDVFEKLDYGYIENRKSGDDDVPF